MRPLLRPRRAALNSTDRRLAGAASIADLRVLARRRAPRAVFDYTDGAAGDELALRRSREAYERVEFSPHVLEDVSSVDTSTVILGRPAAAPFGFAPTSFTRMMHTRRRASRRARRRTDRHPVCVISDRHDVDRRLAAAAPDGRRWFKLYLWRDREASRDFVARAEAAGYEALVLTVDTPVPGPRLRDVRNGLTIPPSLSLKTFPEGALHPAWWFDLLTTEPLEFASLKHSEGTVAELVVRLFDPAATIADLAWLRSIWDRPLLVKGILNASDARAVVDAGGCRRRVEPRGTTARPGRHPVGGAAFRCRRGGRPRRGVCRRRRHVGQRHRCRGGAGGEAALVGRAYLYGLMAGGERGVRRAADILVQEVASTLALLGVTRVAELRPDHVRIRLPLQ